MSEESDRINDLARGFGSRGLAALRSEIGALGVRKSGELLRKLKVQYKKDGEDIYNIRFVFPRQGIFSMLGAGPGNRVAKPWATPLDREVEQLANDVARVRADMAVKNAAPRSQTLK